MAYTKTNWVNGGSPSLNATNLNKIEQGIYDAQTKAEAAQTSANSAQSTANTAQTTANTKQTAPIAGQNVKYGANALATNVGTNNTAIGDNAGRYIVLGGANNSSSSSVYIGDNTVAKADGDENEIVIGHNTEGNGDNSATIGNSLIDEFYVGACVEVNGNTPIGKGVNQHPSRTYDVIIGNEAGYNLTAGGTSVVLGADSSRTSTGGNSVTSFTKAVYIGYNTRPSAASGNDNEIIIGYGAPGYGSNKVHIGNNSIDSISFGAGTGTAFTNRSDRRIKEDITDVDTSICYNDIKNLPLHRFKYKDFVGNEGDQHLTGFIADEFEQVFPKAVFKNDHSFPILDEDGNKVMKTIIETNEEGKEVTREVEETFTIEDCASIDTSQITPTLVGALQAMMAKIEALEAEIKAIKK